MENLFIEAPACRAQLFSALDRVTNLATESYQDASTALPEVAAPSIAPDAVAPLTEPRSALSNAFALAAAVALACVAAFFSIAGMEEIFLGAPVAVMVLAGSLEAGKLIIAGRLQTRSCRCAGRRGAFFSIAGMDAPISFPFARCRTALEVEFDSKLGAVGRAFVEASNAALSNRSCPK